MCSFQTSTGTRLMHRVDEKMGATAVDEEDELLLVFGRLADGAVEELEEDMANGVRRCVNFKCYSSGPETKTTTKPPLFKKCRPKELNKQLARPVHHPPSVRRPAAVRRLLPWRPSSRRLGASTVSRSRFGRNTFARNFSISPNYQSCAAPTRFSKSTGKM